MNQELSYLSTKNLSIGYKSGGEIKAISNNLDLSLHSGQLVCLLGPNGAGKSTLMRTLGGLQPALSGDIFIDNTCFHDLQPAQLAKKLSLVLTEKVDAGNLSVFDVVSLGRTPYTGWLGTLSDFDIEKINWALSVTETFFFKEKRIHQLSDGEKQKVMLARALAQNTNLILLDEPTAHLDLPSRVEIMHLLHTLARKTNKAILLSTHELDLALQTADQLWLMTKDGELKTGIPEDLVLNGAFETTFEKAGFLFDKKTGAFTAHPQPLSFHVKLTGAPEITIWAQRALLREGIGVDNIATIPSIIATIHHKTILWKLNWQGEESRHLNLQKLLEQIKSKRNQ